MNTSLEAAALNTTFIDFNTTLVDAWIEISGTPVYEPEIEEVEYRRGFPQSFAFIFLFIALTILVMVTFRCIYGVPRARGQNYPYRQVQEQAQMLPA